MITPIQDGMILVSHEGLVGPATHAPAPLRSRSSARQRRALHLIIAMLHAPQIWQAVVTMGTYMKSWLDALTIAQGCLLLGRIAAMIGISYIRLACC